MKYAIWNSPKLRFAASHPLPGANCHKAKNTNPTRRWDLFCLHDSAGINPTGLSRRNHEDKMPRIDIQGIFGFVTSLGFEPKTHSLEGCCSIQLSYEANLFAAAKLAQYFNISNLFSRFLPPQQNYRQGQPVNQERYDAHGVFTNAQQSIKISVHKSL